jgi:hypothetical protein
MVVKRSVTCECAHCTCTCTRSTRYSTRYQVLVCTLYPLSIEEVVTDPVHNTEERELTPVDCWQQMKRVRSLQKNPSSSPSCNLCLYRKKPYTFSPNVTRLVQGFGTFCYLDTNHQKDESTLPRFFFFLTGDESTVLFNDCLSKWLSETMKEYCNG